MAAEDDDVPPDMLRQRDAIRAGLAALVQDLRLVTQAEVDQGERAEVGSWSGRVDGRVVRGGLEAAGNHWTLTLAGGAERDPGGLLLTSPTDDKRTRLQTGDAEFDRTITVEAAPRDLALALLDAGTRAIWLRLQRRGLQAVSCKDARMELTISLKPEPDGRFLELDAVLRDVVTLLGGTLTRIPTLPDEVDAGLAGGGGYRGAPGGGDEARTRQQAREQERNALLGAQKRRETVGCLIGFVVMGAAVFGLVMLIRSCV